MIHGWRVLARSRARSPMDCVREFAHCIRRADLHRAYGLIAPVDRDNYTRAAPSAAEHDPVSVKRFAFDSRASFVSYWRSASAPGPASRLILRATGQMQLIGPDMALVELEIHVQRSMRLEREKRALTIHKLVLRHSDEWRVFNGEVAGADELDLGWLRA
jgi:hypothetical protein